jgi:hypothetical protein
MLWSRTRWGQPLREPGDLDSKLILKGRNSTMKSVLRLYLVACTFGVLAVGCGNNLSGVADGPDTPPEQMTEEQLKVEREIAKQNP